MLHLPNPPATLVRGDDTDPSLDATGAALARLASTRRRLLLTLAPQNSASASQADGSATRFPLRWRALARVLMSRGPSAALLRAASATVGQWWHAQPWAAASDMLGRAVAQEVRPVVRRHPWLAVATALALGAVAVSARARLWRAAKPYAKPLGGQIRRGAWSLFTKAPVQMAITALLAAWIGDQQRDATSHSAVPSAAAGSGPGSEPP